MAPAFGSIALLAGCGAPQPTENNAATAVPPPVSETHDNQASVPGAPPAPATSINTAAPDLAPPTLVPEAERGETGARNLLLSFARRIELGQFGQARAMLGEHDRRRWSETQFARLFAGLDPINVAVPTGSLEGAAGTLYYTAPVTITATDRDGRPVRLEGEAVLRRVNDVDGASEAQRRWRFERLALDWTH